MPEAHHAGRHGRNFSIAYRKVHPDRLVPYCQLIGGGMPYKNGRVVCGECGSSNVSILSSERVSYGMVYEYRCHCGNEGQTSDCDHRGQPTTRYDGLKICLRCHQKV